jgi:hydrogenase nickel incorporation protein HypA/HybF
MLASLEDVFPGRVAQVKRMQLTAGILSNVQPILIKNALAAVAADSPQYAHIQLDVVVLPILIHCEACNKTNEVVDYKFVCACGKPSTHIIQGEELHISQVEFEDNEVLQA